MLESGDGEIGGRYIKDLGLYCTEGRSGEELEAHSRALEYPAGGAVLHC